MVLAFDKCLPEELYFLVKEFWFSTNSPCPVGKVLMALNLADR